MKSMSVLVIAEHDNASLKPATLHVVTAAQKVGGDIHILVAGQNCDGAAQAAAKVPGIAKVLKADDAIYAHQLAENVAKLIVTLAPNYSHVMAAATVNGKNIMPRASALLDVQQISEISAVESQDTFVRPTYAGNALATVQSSDKIKVITVRATAFDLAPADGGSATVYNVAGKGDTGQTKFMGQEVQKTERPELTSARIVVSGGRGMQSGDNFKLLEAVADKLNAAVGASRAAVDGGFRPNDHPGGP